MAAHCQSLSILEKPPISPLLKRAGGAHGGFKRAQFKGAILPASLQDFDGEKSLFQSFAQWIFSTIFVSHRNIKRLFDESQK